MSAREVPMSTNGSAVVRTERLVPLRRDSEEPACRAVLPSAANRPVICPVRPASPTITTWVVKVGELSRCKTGMARLPAGRLVFLLLGYTDDRAIVRSRYKFYKWLKSGHVSWKLVNKHMRSIALQVVRKPENSHDILKLNYVQMRALTAVASAKAGVRVQKPLRNSHVSRRKGKNRDK